MGSPGTDLNKSRYRHHGATRRVSPQHSEAPRHRQHVDPGHQLRPRIREDSRIWEYDEIVCPESRKQVAWSANMFLIAELSTFVSALLRRNSKNSARQDLAKLSPHWPKLDQVRQNIVQLGHAFAPTRPMWAKLAEPTVDESQTKFREKAGPMRGQIWTKSGQLWTKSAMSSKPWPDSTEFGRLGQTWSTPGKRLSTSGQII